MARLLEILVALVIVAVLAVAFGFALPSHRHTERSKVFSAPVRQIYDVLDGFHTYPSWSPLLSYDAKVGFKFEGAESGQGAKVDWNSANPRIAQGSLTIADAPAQDKKIVWTVENDWKGTGKTLTYTLQPSENGKTVKLTLAYDVDYGSDLVARYSGLYVEGEPATLVQISLDSLEKFMAAVPNVDYKDAAIEVKDVESKPILYVATQAKRTLDDIADATDKALGQIGAQIKKDKLTQTGPRMTVTTNWGDENYEFDVALPVDRTDGVTPVDPVKVGQSYGGKALVTSFTGSPAQLPITRLLLKAYATTHGYAFDDSGAGPGRVYDELTTTDANAAADNQSFTVTLPITIHQ